MKILKTGTRWLALLLLSLASSLAQAGTKSYYYTDPQGTVLAKADQQGNIVETYDYAPYGVQVLGVPPEGPTGYTGHVNDGESGFVYMQQRYMDPQTGRFLSVDPVGPSPGDTFNFNRYDYTNNNPINHTDPDGRCIDGVTCGTMLKAHVDWRMSHPGAPADGMEKAAFVGVGVVLTASSGVAATFLPEAGGTAALDTLAVNAARSAATAAEGGGATGGATTGLVTSSGEVFTGASANAGGAGAATNPVVQRALDSISPALRSCFHGGCGEINAASNALNAGAKVEGGVMATVRTIGKEVMEACPTCAQVADRLGIKVVSP